MLAINEIKLGKILKINNEPYSVVKTDHHKVARGGAVLKTKLKNLINGNVLEKTFQGNEKAEPAEIEMKQASYLYKDDENAHFMNNTTFEQSSLPLDVVGQNHKFLKEGINIDIMYYDEKPVGMKLPIKVELQVTEAPPGIKGNTASNALKTVTLETGAELQAPLFINTGDTIRINTDTGAYVERV